MLKSKKLKENYFFLNPLQKNVMGFLLKRMPT